MKKMALVKIKIIARILHLIDKLSVHPAHSWHI